MIIKIIRGISINNPGRINGPIDFSVSRKVEPLPGILDAIKQTTNKVTNTPAAIQEYAANIDPPSAVKIDIINIIAPIPKNICAIFNQFNTLSHFLTMLELSTMLGLLFVVFFDIPGSGAKGTSLLKFFGGTTAVALSSS